MDNSSTAGETPRERIIDLPHRVVMARSAISQLPDLLEPFGTPFFIVGPRTHEILKQRVPDLLTSSSVFISEEATVSAARAATLAAERLGAHCVVGVGGGKNIDIAKFVGARLGIPVISVPTIPSHDGIASPMVSLGGSAHPYSEYVGPPELVVVDTDVLASAPIRFFQSGFGDVIGKYTSVYDWWLAHVDTGEYFGHYSAALARMTFRHVVRFRREIASRSDEGVNVLLEALVTNGLVMGIQHSSRPASGSEHLISHALDYLRGRKGPHGLQVGIGTIVAAYLQGRDWERIRRYLEDVDAPTTAEALGISADMMVKALVIAPTLRRRYTIFNRLRMTEELARSVLKKVEVI